MMTRGEALAEAARCAGRATELASDPSLDPRRAITWACLGELYLGIADRMDPGVVSFAEMDPAGAFTDPREVAQCGHGVMAIHDRTTGWLHVMNMDRCDNPPLPEMP